MNFVVVSTLGALAGLFGLALTGFAYAQLKADPNKDANMSLRSEFAASMGADASGWAETQNSATVRLLSFLFALAFTVSAFAVSVWSIWQTLS